MLFSLCECWQYDINTLVRRYQLHDHQSQLLNSRAPSHSLLSRIEWILWARFIVTSHLSSDLAWNSRQNVSTPLIHILFIHITKIRHWFPWRKSKLVLIAYVLGHCGGPRPFLWQTEGCCHTVGVKKCVNSHLNQILLSAFSPAASLLSISVKERCHCKTAMQYRWICEFLWCDFVIKLQKMSNVIFYSSIHFLQMSVHFQTPKMIGPIYRTISVICWSIGFNNSWYMKNVKSYTLWVVVCPPEGTEQILCRQRSYLECHHQMRINLFLKIQHFEYLYMDVYQKEYLLLASVQIVCKSLMSLV